MTGYLKCIVYCIVFCVKSRDDNGKICSSGFGKDGVDLLSSTSCSLASDAVLEVESSKRDDAVRKHSTSSDKISDKVTQQQQRCAVYTVDYGHSTATALNRHGDDDEKVPQHDAAPYCHVCIAGGMIRNPFILYLPFTVEPSVL